MSTRTRTKPFCLLVFALLISAGCTSMYDPIPFAPSHYDADAFVPSSEDRVTLVPVADVRVDTKETINPNTIDALEQHFKNMGYLPNVASSYGAVATVTADDLEEPRSDWVRRFGPDDAQWVFLFAIEDLVSRDKTLGSAYGTECSGYLFDRRTGELAWQHSAAAQKGVGGVVGMLPGTTKRFSVGTCIAEMLAQFPVRGEKRWMRYREFIELRKPVQ